jgi:glycosyltransferase involved in cell wall biosynthesis
MKKLAIISTHPIQYNAPWFKRLGQRQNINLKVFYTWSQTAETVKDKTFGIDIKWDVPLLEGYDYEFIENTSKKPGSHHFFGIDCPELIPRVSAFKPDAILIFGWNFKSHLITMRHFKGKIPVWFRGDSTLLDEVPGWKTRLRRIVLKKVYSYINKAFYVGKANKAYFYKHGLSENQLVYAPHAVNNEHFYNTDQQNFEMKTKAWKNELSIPENQITVVFAGKFEPKKQPTLLLEAIMEANKIREKPLFLVMVGTGQLESELKSKASGQENILFLPFQNQSKMPQVYRLADVFCLPSKGPGETWGLAVNESMACSRPAIVSDKVGCAEDMIVEGENGYIFDHANRDALTKILVQLDHEKLKSMGKNALEHSRNFSLSKIASAIEEELNG